VLKRLADPGSTGDNDSQADIERSTSVSIDNIEARIRHTLEQDFSDQLTEEEEIALLRLLTAFHGLADALDRCDHQARPIDWTSNREERFSW
jgi:hypothetical protein